MFEEKSDDTIETTKYYTNCKHCGKKEYDCVECIIKDIHRTETRNKTGWVHQNGLCRAQFDGE